MSDTIEDLQAQIEKLKDKNYQLLDEKKKAQAQRDELQSQIEPLEQERDKLWQDIQRITVDQPRQELFEAVAMPGMADTLHRELLHHFDIGRTDDGEDVLLNKADGSAALLDDKPLKLDGDSIRKLYDTGQVKSLGAMLKGSGISGGGARGGHGSAPGTVINQTAPAKQFGMR